MSEFPELQGYEAPSGSAPEGISEKSLESRERELLGEAGAAELVGMPTGASGASGASGATGTDTPVELDTEQSSLPSSSRADTPVESGTPTYTASAPGAGPAAYIPKKVDLSESEFLKDWKVKSELEIERRDKLSADKRTETQEKAHKAIDDFYENYNTKKEKEIAKVKTEAEDYTSKRDAEIGSGKGTTWDRIADLMDGLGQPAEGIPAGDKKRFAELIKSLKGDANAPGAAGY